MREAYKKEMDKRYGEGTWDLMELASRKPSKVSQFEIDAMEKHFKELVKNLMKEKCLSLT